MTIASTAWMFSTFALWGLFVAALVRGEFHRGGAQAAFLAGLLGAPFAGIVVMISFGMVAIICEVLK